MILQLNGENLQLNGVDLILGADESVDGSVIRRFVYHFRLVPP